MHSFFKPLLFIAVVRNFWFPCKKRILKKYKNQETQIGSIFFLTKKMKKKSFENHVTDKTKLFSCKIYSNGKKDVVTILSLIIKVHYVNFIKIYPFPARFIFYINYSFPIFSIKIYIQCICAHFSYLNFSVNIKVGTKCN